MTAVAMTNGWPMVQADGVTGKDNDRDFRKVLASIMLADVKSANPLASRNGVLPRAWDSTSCTSLRVQQQSTASPSVDILAGPIAGERTGQGPYVGWTESTVSYTPPSPDGTNPRYDTIFAVVYDQASINTDPLHGPYIDCVSGTPAGSPSPVADSSLPDGAVRLADILRPAGSGGTNIISSQITDKRKSTALLGSTRYMLPGDSVTDPGKIDGELRFRKGVSPLPSLVDYWDATQSLWRGTQPLTFQGIFPGTPDSNNIVSATLVTSGTNIISLTIPDPGWPYRMIGMATFQNNNNLGSVNYYIGAASGPLISNIITVSQLTQVVLIPNSSTIFTGSQIVRLHADVISGGPGCGWATDQRNQMTITVVPA